jgi:TolB-like protein/class 3 adenylate cyclase/Tfp pilus assembly protein PilF
MQQNRQLAAIMFTDIVGYTALMGHDEGKAFEYLRKNRELQKPVIEEFGGKWIKELGDGVMASFKTVSDAVCAAIKIQEAVKQAKEFQLRIGIHQGEVVFENNDVFGDAVNIASRIQSVANPGSIYISESVFHIVSNKKNINTRFIKEQPLKNVKAPVRIYEVLVGNDEPGAISTNSTSPSAKNNGRPGAEKSIAVFPLINMSNDPEQDYFSDGIAEEIINSLAHVKDLKVASRTSTFQFNGKVSDLHEIGEKLKVKTILEGSVRKQGNKIRISVQLINIDDGFHLWSERYDRELDDIFAIQDEIALAITKQLKVTLGIDEKAQITKIYTHNTEAYQLYLKGRYCWNKRSVMGIENSIRYFEEAIAIDPGYALAWAGLSDAYNILSEYGKHRRRDVFPKTKAAVYRALELDNDLAEAHVSLGLLLMLDEWDWVNAGKEYRMGLELNPHYATGHHWYAEWLMYLGRFDEAIKEISLAEELDPVSLAIAKDKGLVYYYSRQYQQAIEQVKKSLHRDSQFATGHRILSLAYQGNKMYEEAIAENSLWELNIGKDLLTISSLAQIHAAAGNKEEAGKIIDRFSEKDILNLSDHRNLALVYGDLGDNDKAFYYLDLGFERKDLSFTSIKIDPKFDRLRADPRFDELIKKMKFPV